MANKMFKLWFYLIAFFFIASILPYANPNNPINLLQGIPWYEVPIATSSYLILLRALYGRRDEQRIKSEYEEENRRNASLTFDHFINLRYPMLFQGYSTSQAQIVAAVAACLSASKDFSFGRTIVRAAGRAKDPRKSVDDIMEALHRDYASLF